METYFIDPEEEVHACIRDNDISGLRVLLASSPQPDLNYRSHWGRPLDVAVWCRNIEAADMLLKAGAALVVLEDVKHPPTDDYFTPITQAAKSGQREMVHLLWHRSRTQAHVEDHNPFRTCLAQAAYEGHVSIVTDLLGWWDGWPQTILDRALQCAALHWHFYVAEALLSKASFDQDNLDTALRMAAEGKKMLTSFEKITYEPIDYYHQQQLVTLLIESGANLNTHCRTAHPPLLSAAQSPLSLGGLVALLEKGADANAIGGKGMSALHFLASSTRRIPLKEPEANFHEAGIRLLLTYGASVCLHNEAGEAPIHLAAMHAPLRILRLYLSAYTGGESAGCIGSMSRFGETLLHFAAAGCQHESIEYLLAFEGVNVNAQSLYGWSPLTRALTPFPDHAKSSHHFKDLDMRVRVARYLLSHGANPFLSTPEGWTPLHCLALHLDSGENGEVQELALSLIEMGVNIEARAKLFVNQKICRNTDIADRVSFQNREEWAKTDISKVELPLLHWAAYYGAVGVLEALLRRGVDLYSLELETGQDVMTTAGRSVALEQHPSVRETVLGLLSAAIEQDYDSDRTMTA
ncbi:Serine/threonine-protein phosphatase 6 regulatory ankyrin repeat subunit B [Paramyrothecium foliicola]|nr:Serine/threonine-protein phosphatase 6 regulatory ankyrin repeat subunit B [Paramyrothecium foliicola]